MDRREHLPVTVELFVEDVRRSIGFYTEILGFQVLRMDPPPEATPFAVLVLEEAAVMLCHESLAGGPPPGPRGLGLDIRIMVSDVDTIYARAKAGGAQIVRDIGDRSYGLRDFRLLDPDGFRLRFASPLAG